MQGQNTVRDNPGHVINHTKCERASLLGEVKPLLQRILWPGQTNKTLLALALFLATPELFEEIDGQTTTDDQSWPQDFGEFGFPE